ncbi:putative ADP,ATP carrier protein [Iris pallida]|uniref:ADP,ATP carrier protein n=1 Tax=Iris pallida TaxID=29817 RepID=A0AAX6ED30_IRIPA|nr:putative ADP,ATP carrier protein [Iris pallida]
MGGELLPRSGGGGGHGGDRPHRGGADRACEAHPPDAGEQRRHTRALRPPEPPEVPRDGRLHRQDRQGGGGPLVVARERDQRHPLLPLRRPQLLPQGSLQDHVKRWRIISRRQYHARCSHQLRSRSLSRLHDPCHHLPRLTLRTLALQPTLASLIPANSEAFTTS